MPLSRSRLAAVPFIALLVAACQDRPGPLSPDAPRPRASLVATTCDAAADARAHELVNVVFGPTERDPWHVRFNKGRVAAAAGDVAGAWEIYAPLLTAVAAQSAAAPAGSPVPAAANELTSLILVCSGQPAVDPALLDLLNLPEAERILRDVTFAVATPGADFELVTPKRHFGVSAAAGFFDETALLVISRIDDAPPFLGTQFVEYPPRFNVTVIPYTAQANFDNVGDPSYGPEDVVNEGVVAQVAICPGAGHPDAGIRVLRRPEPFLSEPTALLPLSVPAVATSLACAEAGSQPYPALATTTGMRVFAGLATAASHVADLLLPRRAFALDGGIGGETFLFSDYVAATPVLHAPDAPLVDRVVFTVDGAVVTHLPLSPRPSETVTAVPQRAVGGGYAPIASGVTCSWSSSKPSGVSVSAKPGELTAKLVRARRYTGAAKVTAVCNGTGGSLQILPGTAQGG